MTPLGCGARYSRRRLLRLGVAAQGHAAQPGRFVLSAQHIGRFDACELYAFVETDGKGAVRRLYWVQFEAYLPSHPRLQHTYDSPRHRTIGGLDFYVDTSVSRGTARPARGSDEDHLYALLAMHGYRRGVHIAPDEAADPLVR